MDLHSDFCLKYKYNVVHCVINIRLFYYLIVLQIKSCFVFKTVVVKKEDIFGREKLNLHGGIIF